MYDHLVGDVIDKHAARIVLRVGGVGYEDVEVSSRDAVRDDDGNPVFDNTGRLITDTSSPRLVAFEVDGLLWDVGVLWRPSSRTNLEARVGRRYDSTTYYGTFAYQPRPGDSLAIAVYDGISGFGGVVNNSLSKKIKAGKIKVSLPKGKSPKPGSAFIFTPSAQKGGVWGAEKGGYIFNKIN